MKVASPLGALKKTKSKPAKLRYEGEEDFGLYTDTIHKVMGRWMGSAELVIEGIRLRLYYLGISENTGRGTFAFHSHAFAEFLYTMDGEGALMGDEARPELRESCPAGHVHVARPGVRHGSSWNSSTQKPWRGLVVQFEIELPETKPDKATGDLSLAQQFAPFYDYFFIQRRDTLQLPPELHREALAIIEFMRTFMLHYPEAGASAILGCVVTLIGLFSFHLNSTGAAAGQGVVLPLGNMEKKMQRAKMLLEDPVLAQVPITEIARRVGMSPYHFIREFGKACAVPPQKYRHGVIMERASKMLIQTDEPIYLVAEAAGFADPSAFSKSFMNYFKKSPIVFRAQFSRAALPTK